MPRYNKPPLDGFDEEQAKRMRELRVAYLARGAADKPSDDTVADLVPVMAKRNGCRCLVCGDCDSRTTIDFPAVCQQCTRGSHMHGGVL